MLTVIPAATQGAPHIRASPTRTDDQGDSEKDFAPLRYMPGDRERVLISPVGDLYERQPRSGLMTTSVRRVSCGRKEMLDRHYEHRLQAL
jgi:hypothetical protein